MFVRIPLKWATDSGGMWAGLERASRRRMDMMTEVAHMGQEKVRTQASSSRFHHFVSIISFLVNSAEEGHHSGDVGHRNGGQSFNLLPAQFDCGTD